MIFYLMTPTNMWQALLEREQDEIVSCLRPGTLRIRAWGDKTIFSWETDGDASARKTFNTFVRNVSTRLGKNAIILTDERSSAL